MFLKNNSYLYSPSFEYNEYDVIKQNNFRYYKIKEKLVPSVTSIIRLSRLNQNDVFSNSQADSFEIGNLMHEILDRYVTNKSINVNENRNSQIAAKLSKTIIDNIFPTIDKFISSEAIIHEGLKYAGRLDLLAEIDGKLTIIDYKSSFRKKSAFLIDEHFQQLAAYAIAHDKMFDTKIESAKIFVAYKGTYDHEIIEADSDLLSKYKLMWAEKLNYYNDVSV